MSLAGLPWRGPGEGRPELPLPPAKVPARRHGSWRKQWRYLGAFCDELMLCAARVQVGPAGQTFWAIWDRAERRLYERTRMLTPLARGEVWTEPTGEPDAGQVLWAPDEGETTVRIEAPARGGSERVRGFLTVSGGEWVESACPVGEANYAWTRKRPSAVELDLRIGERRIRTQARGIEDESCGYHPRETEWSWSAGIGRAADGREVAWNLVSGINDPPERSERAVWVTGEASEPGPASFEGLEAVAADGARLEFSAEAERSREERKPFVQYSYRQPFGTFAGTLPGGIALDSGMGVMEHHRARW